MKNLPSDKATAGEVTVNVLKNTGICFLEVANCFNETIRNNKLPDSLKLSDKTIVYKKLDPRDEANNRPVRDLSLLWFYRYQ